MRILFFSKKLSGGGAERVLVNLSEELTRRGHEVCIALNQNIIDYDLDSRVQIIEQPDSLVKKSLLQKVCGKLLSRKKIYTFTRDTIKTIKPDVIITFLHCNMLPIICYHGNIPIIHSEHNAYDRNLGFKYYFERFYLNRFFSKVCVLTPFDSGFANAKGLNNTIVMPNPNTFDSISKDEYSQLFPQRKNILICGRVSDWKVKGMDLALMSFAKIAEQYPDVTLDIVGLFDETSRDYLTKMSYELEIQDQIKFCGQQYNVKEIMQQHQFLILSSRTEGFPMVVTEAMTQGLPCVCFEKLATSIITNGIDGLLVNNNDLDALADALRTMITNKEMRYRMGLESIKNVERFSRKAIVDRWETHIFNAKVHDKSFVG